MIIHKFNEKWDVEETIRTSSSHYKTWLKQHGDKIHVITENSKPDSLTALVEVYRGNIPDHYHYIEANPQERIAITRWLSQPDVSGISVVL